VTDREALLALLERFGLVPLDRSRAAELPGEPTAQSVIIQAGHGGAVGYGEFFAEFTFDESGKFIEAGIWE
jgi:hypothetical protein